MPETPRGAERTAGKGRRRLTWPPLEYKYELLARRQAGQSFKEILAYFEEHGAKISEQTAHKYYREAATDPTLVQVTVVAPRPEENDLRRLVAECLFKRYKIRHVEIMGNSAYDQMFLGSAPYWSTNRRQLGALAARHVEHLLERGEIPKDAVIALSGGRSSAGFVEALFTGTRPAKPRFHNLVFRPCTVRSHWRVLSHAEPGGILERLVYRFGYEGASSHGRIQVLSPPATPHLIRELRRQPSRDLWNRHPEIDAVVGPEATQPHLVVTGIGHRWFVPSHGEAPHEETSRLVRHVAEESYYFPAQQNTGPLRPRKDIKGRLLKPLDDRDYRVANHALWTAGAVAELVGTALTAEGERVPEDKFNQAGLGIGVGLERLQHWVRAGTRSIGMVGCSRMVHALHATLASTPRCFTDLVLDSAVALELLRLERTKVPPVYAHIPRVQEPPKVAKPSPKLPRANWNHRAQKPREGAGAIEEVQGG